MKWWDMPDSAEAMGIVNANVTKRNAVCHMLAVEVIIQATAGHLEVDIEK